MSDSGCRVGCRVQDARHLNRAQNGGIMDPAFRMSGFKCPIENVGIVDVRVQDI
jgi:hypothetical protein